jgi:hypothetical protein
MPVIIRSHESSGVKITDVWEWGIKIATYQRTILQAIDIERNYFSFEEICSPAF